MKLKNLQLKDNTRLSTHRVRHSSPNRKPGTSPRNRTFTLRRQFQPRINKSYVCYKENARKNFSMTLERGRIIQTREGRYHSQVPSYSSTNKSVVDNSSYQVFEQKTKNLKLQELMTAGDKEMAKGRHEMAINYYNRVLQDKPQHTDALYNRAVCHMHLDNHQAAIPDLMMVMKEQPLYDSQLYIALSMCFISITSYKTALKFIAKGISKYPKYSEGYVIRGQLLNLTKQYDKAIPDFYMAMNLDPNQESAYTGLADSLIGLGDQRGAIQALTQGSMAGNANIPSIIKRGRLWLALNEPQKAVNDMDLCIGKKSDNPEVYYIKAQCLEQTHEYNDAVLCYEQCIKHDKQLKFTGRAIFRIGNIKIIQKDFYGASYTFNRAVEAKVKVKEQKHLEYYVDAVLNLMRRKYKEAIPMLTVIIKKKRSQLKDFIPNCYSFRAFAYVATENYDKAIRNYDIAQKIQKLDSPSLFNKLMAQGISAAKQKDTVAADAYFDRARTYFEHNTDPQTYKAILHLQSLADETSANKKRMLNETKQVFDECIASYESDSYLHFFRGLVLYLLQSPIEAIKDLDQAIEKAEENQASHYVIRGVCYATLRHYAEAIQDFSIALQIQDSLARAYYFRGRCAFIMEDSNLAFADFQKLISLEPENPEVHIHAGDLLLLTGSYDDAIQAYDNANDIKATPTCYFRKAACYLILNDLINAEQSLQMVQKLNPSQQGLSYDLEFIAALKLLPPSASIPIQDQLKSLAKLLRGGGTITGIKYAHWYRGIVTFYNCDYTKSEAEFRAALGPLQYEKVHDPESPNAKFQQEAFYNLCLCYTMMQDYENAVQSIQEALYSAQGADKAQLLLLMGMLKIGLEEHSIAREIIMDAYKFDAEMVNQYLDNSATIHMTPLNSASPYAQQFPEISIQIAQCNPIVTFIQLIKPSFSYPFPVLPSLKFKQEEGVMDYFDISAIKFKPEAPWLNRVNGMVQFTEQIDQMGSRTVSATEISDDDRQFNASSSEFEESGQSSKIYKSLQGFSKEWET